MSQTDLLRMSTGSAAAISFDDEPAGLGLGVPPALIQYWQAILRRRLLIIAIIAAAIALGVVYTMLQPRLYTARSQIEISRSDKNFTNVQGVEQDTNPYDLEYYDTQYNLLKAQSLAERIVRKLNLANDPSFFSDGFGITTVVSDKSPAAVRTRERQATGLLLGGIGIKPVANSSLVDITFSSRSPQWSARLASAWPREFIAASMDRRFGATVDARRLLEERLDTLRIRLEESEQKLIAFGNAHDIITLSSVQDADGKTTETRTLVGSNLDALNSALMQARSERIAAQSRAGTAAGDASADVLQSTTVSGLRAKRAEVAAEYSRLLVQFEPGYPAARALKDEMDALDTAIARETARVNRGRHATYAEAVARENQLAAQVESLKGQFLRQQQDRVQYNILQREVDTNRQLYDALLQRYKEIGVAGTVGVSNVAIVDDAKVPGAPSSPNLSRSLMLALLLGIGLAGAVVLFLEQFDQAIRNPGDVEALLGLPLLGSVPAVEEPPLPLLADSKSNLSEAYFSVQATLALATAHGFPKLLAIASAEPREGKSLTAFALAITLGRTGKRVLLVDGDMRSPSAHVFAGVDNVRGLSNLLSGDEALAAMVKQSEFKNVWILPAGPTPPSAAELLGTDRLKDILSTLRQSYDHIVIDGPPVIGLADSPLIGRAVDGMVMVMQANDTALQSVRGALHRLKVGDNQIFGAIVTKVDEARFGYGYGYNYEYRYGNAPGDQVTAA